jgi:3-oxoacyl-[acyl-carrier-protein] synthase II
MLRPVVVTGVGVVTGGVVGGGDSLRRFLATPGRTPGGRVVDGVTLGALIDGADARRTSRVSQLALAATRLALADAGLDTVDAAGLILGTEHGDLHSTIEFADGYLRGGPTGLSPLLFPNTVMNTMASATTIAVGARGPSLTLNVRTVGGELAVARAARTVASGRLDVALAGGVDALDSLVGATLAALGAGSELRGEGATMLVLEALDHALARGASPCGEILGAAWRGLAARPNGVGRRVASAAIGAALAEAGLQPSDIIWVYGSASGDESRDAWERTLLSRELGPRATVASLAPLLGQHAGLGALRVAAAAWTASSGLLAQPPWRPSGDDVETTPVRVPRGPGLVHGLARGGTHVALVIDGPPDGTQ